MPVFAAKPISSLGTIVAGLDLGFLFAPPAWTRLEPQSATGDPAPGLAARVHDPLWLLARQWQFCEFAGENAGTPLSVSVTGESRRIGGFKPANGPATAFAAGDLLDPLVEREPPSPSGPGLRARAEAGLLLAAALEDAGHDARAALRAACPFDPATSVAGLAPGVGALVARAPDGQAAAVALEAETPGWLGGASAAAEAAAAEWLGWYRAGVSPRAAGDCWLRDRLEYGFAVSAGEGGTLEAAQHGGGEIDWFSFALKPGASIGVAADPARSFGPDPGANPPAPVTALTSPLVYHGMPADRLWEFEDGAAYFGGMDVQNNDVARLCLVEFAMIYGCDWFVAPLDVPRGSIARIDTLTVVDSFGEPTEIAPAPVGPPGRRFRLFAVADLDGSSALDGLVTPQSILSTAEGEALERVDFFRDEGANMGWAVERTVQDAAGDPRSRDGRRVIAPEPDLLEGAELLYSLQTDVPKHWLPMVPTPTGTGGGFVLRKGTMTGEDEALGRILEGTSVDLRDEELPRAGVSVIRVPCLARDPSGRRVRWIARRATTAFGEISSKLAFDSAERPG